MKKITALILSAVMILAMFVPTYAETNIGVSVKIEDDGNNGIIYAVEIKGSTVANDKVSFEITDSTNKTYVLEQFTSDDLGNFSYSNKFLNSGSYNIYVNSYKGNAESGSFTLKDKSYYQDVVDTFNLGTVDEVISVIDTKGTDLGFDKKYYNDDTKDEIASKILEQKGNISIFNLTEIFDKSVAVAYLSNPDLYHKADEIIEYYDDYLNIKSSDEKIYSDYTEFDDDVKEVILKDAFDGLSNTDEAEELFNLSVAKNIITLVSASKVDEFIKDHNDYYEFDGYEELSDIRRSKILSILQNSDLGDNLEDLQDAYDEAYNSTKPNSSNKGGSATGGGGRVSGGSVGKTGSTTEFGKESIVKPADISDLQIQFTDIDDVSWAKTDILSLAMKGIVNGKTKTVFAPNDHISREEYSKIMSLAFGFYDENAMAEFNDISTEDWSYRYIASMYKEGCITGYPDGSFGGKNNISRQDIAVILYRLMQKNKYLPQLDSVANSFGDYEEIDDYAKNAVLMLSHEGVINGSDGNFNPKQSATRAEVCVIVNRALNYINK